eukprot:13203444-Alexandrium_andersonii.AAC.1
MLNDLTLLQVNIRGYTSHRAELESRLQQLDCTPMLVMINETFLDAGSETPLLSGFTIVARRDRSTAGGGVLVFAKDSTVDVFTFVQASNDEERVWLIAHS